MIAALPNPLKFVKDPYEIVVTTVAALDVLGGLGGRLHLDRARRELGQVTPGWSEDMSFRLSFHQPLLGPTGAHWLDDPPDVTC